MEIGFILLNFCWWRDIRRFKVRSVAEALGVDYKAWLATCQRTDLISVMCAVPIPFNEGAVIRKDPTGIDRSDR